jgi:glycosyltransferase involved in cell wall biosynthesis
VEAEANLSGGQKSNLLIAEAMARRGHDVRLAYVDVHPWPSLRSPRRFARRLSSELRNLGRPRHFFHSDQIQLIPVRRSRIEAHDLPDADFVIGTWWETMEWIAAWPPSKGRKAYFVRHYELHGGDPERVKATYRMPYTKLVTSSWLRRILEDEFGERDLVMVPNGVDWTQFDSVPREKQARPTVGFMTSDKRFKATDVALAAVRHAQRAEPALRAVSFGTSPPPRHHGVRDLEFHLRPERDRVADLYRSVDGWMIASEAEGFGMPGLEAAACRCPVVSTRCGGPEDYVVDGETGYLVGVGDASGLAEGLLDVVRLAPDRWRAMSEASYRQARRFDWDRSAERLEQALLERLERPLLERRA